MAPRHPLPSQGKPIGTESPDIHSAESPQERVLRGRIAAFSLHAQGGTNTGPARAAFNTRFEREVDPQGTLSPAERQRRAACARKAHFLRLALKSAQVRRRRAQNGGDDG